MNAPIDDLAAPRAAVAGALRELERALERFLTALAHERATAVVQGIEEPGEALRAASDAFGAIDLGMEDAPNTSVVCVGVVAASREVAALAVAVNEAKAALKTVCVPLQKVRRRVPERGGGTRALPLVRVVLRSIGRSDLNLLAAYRRIQILGAMPVRISYTRARTRAVYKKTIEATYRLLDGSDAPAAIRDRARLEALPAAETHLALVRDHYDNMRANIVYEGLDRRGRGRVQVPAELPLLYVPRRSADAPVVEFPDDSAGPTRTRRTLIEPSAFLESLPVHRYKR
jgi:hypothetical protein